MDIDVTLWLIEGYLVLICVACIILGSKKEGSVKEFFKKMF